LLLIALVSASLAQKLNTYRIDPTQISTSGISAGGAMANQIQVAFSQAIMGAGIVAGPPYFCAMDLLAEALVSCTTQPGGISLELLYAATEMASALAQIDNIGNLTKAKIMLFTGADDSVVVPGVMAITNTYYSHFIPSKNINFINEVYQAAHGWPTNNYGNPCSTFAAPYIINCNYDWAGAMLQWIYGNFSAPVTAGQLQTFDQSFYTGSYTPAQISLDKTGVLYVPSQCQNGKALCKLHITFHGCNMGYGAAGLVYPQHAYLNEWAEANNVIVLYPQAIQSQVEPFNPEGCFDWWGYTTSEYFVKGGPQMATVANMVNALVGSNVMNL